MSDEQTRKVIDQFNQAFQQHDPGLLKDLLAENCRLENSGPAPDGSKHVGYDECLRLLRRHNNGGRDPPPLRRLAVQQRRNTEQVQASRRLLLSYHMT